MIKEAKIDLTVQKKFLFAKHIMEASSVKDACSLLCLFISLEYRTLKIGVYVKHDQHFDKLYSTDSNDIFFPQKTRANFRDFDEETFQVSLISHKGNEIRVYAKKPKNLEFSNLSNDASLLCKNFLHFVEAKLERDHGLSDVTKEDYYFLQKKWWMPI